MSKRELAARIGVSLPSLLRYESGQRAIPEDAWRALEELSRSRIESPEVAVLRAVGDGGKTVPELNAVLVDRRHRRELARMIDDGGLALASVARTDSRNRPYVTSGVFPGRGDRKRGLDRSAPITRGSTLAAARRRQGLSVQEVSGRMGVRPSTYRGWEATSPPRARLPKLTIALDGDPTGVQIRRARAAAGWSLKAFGDRVSVHFSTVSNWESGYRPIPRAWMTAIAAALDEAEKAEQSRPDPFGTLVNRLVLLVDQEPGIAEHKLRHRTRIRRDRVQRANPDFERALRSALRSQRVAAVETFHLDSPGRARSTKRIFPADQALPRPPKVTGHELFALRSKAGLTQGEVARAIGVTQGAVSAWERRGDRPIPNHRPTQIEAAMSVIPQGLNSDQLVRARIVEAVRKIPGVPRWRLFERVGHSKTAKNALRAMVHDGELVEGEARDSVGRPYPGIYLAGTAPSLSPGIAGREIRRRRRQSNLSAKALGELVGVRPNTITRYETNARSCPPDRQTAIQALSD
jgi:transcriptional regulator with XRE-family HTH domain